MSKKQKRFVFKPEFVGQTVFDLPADFPTTWTKLHGTYNDDYIRLDIDFKINIEERYIFFEPFQPLTMNDEFAMIVFI